MADYIATYKDGPDRPIVTHSQNGVAMVYADFGNLVEAPSLAGFYRVQPVQRAWAVNGTFGIGRLTEESHE